MIGIKNADKIKKVSKTSPRKNSETVTTEEKRTWEIYISPEKTQKVINDY